MTDVRETIRSAHSERPCKLFLRQTYGERCSNCTTSLQTKNIFWENKKQPNKCNSDSHTAISKLTFQELLERYKNLKNRATTGNQEPDTIEKKES